MLIVFKPSPHMLRWDLRVGLVLLVKIAADAVIQVIVALWTWNYKGSLLRGRSHNTYTLTSHHASFGLDRVARDGLVCPGGEERWTNPHS
jgi:hypothetical protein